MRTSRDEWAKRVERWQDSGLSAEQFASELGINAGTLKFWRYKLRRPRTEPSTRPAAKPTTTAHKAAAAPLPLIEVRGAATGAELFELELGGGRRLRIPASFEASALERLLAVLGRAT
jgi:transposase